MKDHSIRLRLEERERKFLSPLAVRSSQSRGRLRAEPPCPLRTAFQRDRDRIIHCKAFRRLKHKTQVFISPAGDHYVTRLTHTLEVTQIARTIARSLDLNEDLVEAISLGHDLGHTPFGHVGEEALNELYPGGFRHQEQSLRVVDLLEKDGQGLNLTLEVREGILSHSKTGIMTLKGWEPGPTLEAEVCRMADVIAYLNHDLADAIRAGLITERELPPSVAGVLGNTSSSRINAMVTDVVKTFLEALTSGVKRPLITMSQPVLDTADALRQFLFQRVYLRRDVAEVSRAREVIAFLYRYYTVSQGKVPEEFPDLGEGRERWAVDYVAGMTDQYALRLAEELRGPKRVL